MSPSECALYDAHAAAIDHAIFGVCRLRRIRGAEVDEFAQRIRVWLLEDVAALLKFEGKSDTKTYFFELIDNKFLDWTRQRDGRWRPSAVARREGPQAIEFEALFERDGLTPHEAIETMHAKHGASYANLEALWLRLPGTGRMRSKPRVVSLDVEGVSARAERASALHPEDLHNERDDARMTDLVQTSVNRALPELRVDQRRILVEHFSIGGVQATPRADDRRRPPNQAQLRLALDALKELLASCGIGWPEVRRALESGGIEIKVMTPETELREGRPRQDKTRQDKTRQER